MLKVGIVGAAGFVGGELIRLIYHHPKVQLLELQSSSQGGQAVSSIHADLIDLNLQFSSSLSADLDVIFISRGHGASKSYLEMNPPEDHQVVIDMSRDFRIMDGSHDFIYGLPEWQRSQLQSANHIANCGCFATAIQLAIYPLLKEQMVTHDVHVNGITGSTGAGWAKLDTTHFSWRTSNVSIYKAFNHQHMDEVNQLAGACHFPKENEIIFVPMRGNFTRGILVSAYTKTDRSLEELWEVYQQAYNDEPFVYTSKDNIHLKQVVNTNNCLIQVEKHGQHVMITSVIDNLLKGAAGQAVQNMNIRFGLDEKMGLKLKASAF